MALFTRRVSRWRWWTRCATERERESARSEAAAHLCELLNDLAFAFDRPLDLFDADRAVTASAEPATCIGVRAVVVARVGVGAGVCEGSHGFRRRRAMPGGDVHWRPAVVIARVGVGAGVCEGGHGFRKAIPGGDVHWRPAIVIARVGVGAEGGEDGHGFRRAKPDGGEVHWCPAVAVIARVGVGAGVCEGGHGFRRRRAKPGGVVHWRPAVAIARVGVGAGVCEGGHGFHRRGARPGAGGVVHWRPVVVIARVGVGAAGGEDGHGFRRAIPGGGGVVHSRPAVAIARVGGGAEGCEGGHGFRRVSPGGEVHSRPAIAIARVGVGTALDLLPLEMRLTPLRLLEEDRQALGVLRVLRIGLEPRVVTAHRNFALDRLQALLPLGGEVGVEDAVDVPELGLELASVGRRAAENEARDAGLRRRPSAQSYRQRRRQRRKCSHVLSSVSPRKPAHRGGERCVSPRQPYSTSGRRA